MEGAITNAQVKQHDSVAADDGKDTGAIDRQTDREGRTRTDRQTSRHTAPPLQSASAAAAAAAAALSAEMLESSS